MAKKAVNHPPTPVVESATAPAVVEVDCEALKAKWKLNVDTYAAHEEPKSWTNQSHHILQKTAVEDYISWGEGLCVLLGNGTSGTPHQATTARQNERMRNKKTGTGTQPATNVGGLKDLSQGDLTESFKKMGVPDEEAAQLAKCLVDEADEHMREKAKRNKGKNVTDSSPVDPPGGCFPAGTIVWLDAKNRRRIGKITTSHEIGGLDRTRPVVRRDWCRSELVTLHLASGARDAISLAPFHRVRDADGRYRRANSLRPGMAVQTNDGPVTLVRVDRDPTRHLIHSIGVGVAFECRVGRSGVWVALPDTGVRVIAVERAIRFKP